MLAGIGILLLMLAATVLSVTFATRGAMATNRPIVEVLHFIGAKGGFIASQFQRHFLVLGLEGGLIGGGLAMLVFALAGIAADIGRGTAGGDQLAALFGTFSLGLDGYLAILAQIVLIAAVTALDVAAHRQPDAGDRRLASCHPGSRILRYHRRGQRV